MFQEDVMYRLNTLVRAVQELKSNQEEILNKLGESSDRLTSIETRINQMSVSNHQIDDMEVVSSVVTEWFNNLKEPVVLPRAGLPVLVDRDLLLLLQKALNRSVTFSEKLEMRNRALALITNAS